MNYCRNCGEEIIDGQPHVCPMTESNVEPQIEAKPKYSVMAIIAFVIAVITTIVTVYFTVLNFTIDDLGFVVIFILDLLLCLPLNTVSIVMSIIAMAVTVKGKKRGKAFAITDLVLSGASLCMVFAIFAYPFIIQSMS